MVDLSRLQTIVCRPALPRDSEDVIELTRTIWEGHDYIPQVWQSWLAETDGLLAAAELGGHVVGVGKLTRFGLQEWWLEGLRVHPEYQGQGIASHLHDYIVDYWERACGGVLRLATAAYNVKVHHMCERDGMKRIAEFSAFKAGAVAEPVDSFDPLRLEDVSRGEAFARQSPTLAWSAGLMDLGWRWAEVSEVHLAKVAQRGEAWWWRGGAGLLCYWVDENEGERIPAIQLAACKQEQMAELLRDYRRLMARLGLAWAGWIASLHPDLQSILLEAGFVRDWDESLYVYERRGSRG
jgi:GNAT superfamily N-acetyltransferase